MLRNFKDFVLLFLPTLTTESTRILMKNKDEKLRDLVKRFDTITRLQEAFTKEIDGMKSDLRDVILAYREESQKPAPDPKPVQERKAPEIIREEKPKEPKPVVPPVKTPPVVEKEVEQPKQVEQPKKVEPEKVEQPKNIEQPKKVETPKKVVPVQVERPKRPEPPVVLDKPKTQQKKTIEKTSIEKFIGENLINKIGIIITLLGLGVGTKYAIDHDLISPLMRILIGYGIGFGFLGFAFKLKKKYENFSAVLFGGGMASHYILTYISYGFYDFIPKPLAFGIMFALTVGTCLGAIMYNRQIIAIIGLVGAYAVPFILSDGSGEVAMLFSYMTVINIGTIFLSVYKKWRALFYFSFSVSWLIYIAWYIMSLFTGHDFAVGLGFLIVFYLTYEISGILLSLSKIGEEQRTGNLVVSIINTIVYYTLGTALIMETTTGEYNVGIFSICLAGFHFVKGYLFREKEELRISHYFNMGLMIFFTCIAILTAFSINNVILLWTGVALILFALGRIKTLPFYEASAYPVIFISLIALLTNWAKIFLFHHVSGEFGETYTVIFNTNFMSSIMVVTALSAIVWLKTSKRWESPIDKNNFLNILHQGLTMTTILVGYMMFRTEIAMYFNSVIGQFDNSFGFTLDNSSIQDYKNYKELWILNYTLVYIAAIGFINLKWLKSKWISTMTMIVSWGALLFFLASGLYTLSELRESYLMSAEAGINKLLIRYISLGAFCLLIYTNYQIIQKDLKDETFQSILKWFIRSSILWVASSELIHWFDLFGWENSYKLGLSLLWGIYAFVLIYWGIRRKNQALRISAMALFGFTLTKLFLYDIAHLNTLAKTIVFVSLGIMLLIISFLYNKFKDQIGTDEPENKT